MTEPTTPKRATLNLDDASNTPHDPTYQISISAMSGPVSGYGYRLMGPSYIGQSRRLRAVELDQRDADEIRAILDDVFPQEVAAPAAAPTAAPPVDTDLRDRIRRAICEASGFTWLPDELMEPDEYGEHADAVLAVLPAPAEVCICGHTEAQHFEDCCQVCDCGTFLVPEAAREMITHLHAAVLRLKAAAPTDRAAADQPADRRDRYVQAARDLGHPQWDAAALADAVMAVADAEQAELRAEVERLRTDRARVENVLETEHVLGRSAETYRRLLRVALMADKTQQPTDAEERPEDTARRFARRLNAVERLCSGRPGYHTITVKQVLTAMSDADDEAQQPETEAVATAGPCPDCRHISCRDRTPCNAILSATGLDLARCPCTGQLPDLAPSEEPTP